MTVDTAERTVRKGGQVVALTPTEYALVELLALHKGKLVTRTMVYEHTYETIKQTVSFAQQVNYQGRPLWHCPGIGAIKMDEEVKDA